MAHGDRGDHGRARYCRRERERTRRLNAIPIKTIHGARALPRPSNGNVALDPSTITAIKIRVNNRAARETRRRAPLC